MTGGTLTSNATQSGFFENVIITQLFSITEYLNNKGELSGPSVFKMKMKSAETTLQAGIKCKLGSISPSH